jgi:hypothetical protein
MAKGYWVVFADVNDPEGYKEYIAANGGALAKIPECHEAPARPFRMGYGDHRGL